jgi:predicted AAA+ superfamily ATPase
MSYDTKSLREFLLQRFNDSELTQLCFDYFLDVFHHFSDSWRKGDKIQMLLEHCLVYGRFPDLMAALERERPSAFQEYFPKSLASQAITQSPPAPVTRNSRQVFISHAHQDAAFARRLAERPPDYY